MPARPVPLPPRPAPRVPTVWTRRLQVLLLVVAGFGLLSALISAALLPSEWSRMEGALASEWQGQGIPSGEISALQQTMSSVLVVAIVFLVAWALGYCALQVVGTLRRWVWWYWVQFAICCLAALSLLVTLLDLVVLLATAHGGGPPAVAIYRAEAATIPLTILGDVLSVGAGICMLIAAIRIGPWAMTRGPDRLEVRQVAAPPGW